MESLIMHHYFSNKYLQQPPDKLQKSMKNMEKLTKKVIMLSKAAEKVIGTMIHVLLLIFKRIILNFP